MKTLIIIALALAVISLVIGHKPATQQPVTQQFEIWEGGSAFANFKEMKCENDIMDFSFEVRINPDLPKGVLARWTEGKDLMQFTPSHTDWGTISHEVYHMTQTMKRRYGLVDEELSAYMQGAMTVCVYTLLNLSV